IFLLGFLDVRVCIIDCMDDMLGLQGTPRPFSRLMETVEKARAAREAARDEKSRATLAASIRGHSGSKSSIGRDSMTSRRSMDTSPERRKSILKHRDPEQEQLLSDPTFDPRSNLTDMMDSKNSRSNLKKPGERKPHNLPVKFVGIDDDDQNRPRRVLPRSPIPRRHTHRAPLADLWADFAGQEKAARDETQPENKMKDKLEPSPVYPERFDISNLTNPNLDQRNANLILRCTVVTCLYNQPASITPTPTSCNDMGTNMRLCLCGAPMTHVPAPSSLNTIITRIPPTPINAINIPISQLRMENCILPDDINNGSKSANDGDEMLYADHSPTEETRLLDRSSPLILSRNNSNEVTS
ncbi:unnamed protein product, partial [Meganyctiphanes norvegica]